MLCASLGVICVDTMLGWRRTLSIWIEVNINPPSAVLCSLVATVGPPEHYLGRELRRILIPARPNLAGTRGQFQKIYHECQK